MKFKKYKKLLLLLGKITLSLIILYYIFTKVNLSEIAQVYTKSDPVYIVISLILYLISKVISSFRLLKFYQIAQVKIGYVSNLKLYAVGMFYNLFLPGGIGGDAYKVYILKKEDDNLNTKELIKATLLDRLSGLIVLVILILIFLANSGFIYQFKLLYSRYLYLLAIAIFPVFYLVIKLFFKKFIISYFKTSLLSVSVQLIQLFSALLLFKSLGIVQQLFDYLTLFLISSIALVIPFFHGGVGAREYVFYQGAKIVNTTPENGLAFSIAFFTINAFVSLIGLFFLKSKSASLATV